jgi:chorismate mutase
MAGLEELRDEVDAANREILKALACRVELTRKIARVKRQEGRPLNDLEREENLINMMKKIGKEMNLPESLVNAVYQTIIDHSKAIMTEIK